MQGIDATFDDVSLDRGRDPRQLLLKIVPGAAAFALAGSLGVSVLHLHRAPPAAIVDARSLPAPAPAPAADVPANLFGEIIIDPSFVAEMNAASPEQKPFPLPSLDAAPSTSSAATAEPETAPVLPSAAIPLPEIIPLPPRRDVPEIADTAPLPPPRPAEFAALPPPVASDRATQPNDRTARGAAAPDNRNIFEKLCGFVRPSGEAVASRPTEGRGGYSAPDGRAAYAAPEGRVPGMSIFGGFSGAVGGYDRWTAVYDISARTLYRPDGTRLEAHSGYGDKLDDPRYVSERMRGATPPNVYELTPREALFHGVQALRMTPVGDSSVFGRDGFLLHPYMLGPNGDSNGCVSVKDYNALLRAYQNGQIKKLAVVARLG
jgi:hypothetical protein